MMPSGSATVYSVCALETVRGTTGRPGAAMTEKAYVFAGTSHEAEFERLRAVEAAFDPGTRYRLLAAGLCEGWRCLEVGAGAGSIAKWMSDTVAPAGCVLAV